MKKVLGAILAVVLLAVLGGAVFILGMRPQKRPAPALKVEATPEKLARGRYLAENVSVCFHCHSQADLSVFGTPPKPGTLAGGGMCLGADDDFPGAMCAPNITPDADTGLGQWTDGEIVRAIREGVSRDGRALMPIMPYGVYRGMADEDVEAIVAYLRTLPPLRSSFPPTQLDFPVNLIIRFIPKPLEGAVAAPSRADHRAYGQYLVAMGGCGECHTPTNDKHEPVPGKLLAGGQEFPLAKGAVVRSVNITPHKTGLGDVSRGVFISLFKQHALAESMRQVPLARNTVMAWRAYAGMTEEDLGAIYDYLQTVPPVDNPITPWSTPAGAASAPL